MVLRRTCFLTSLALGLACTPSNTDGPTADTEPGSASANVFEDDDDGSDEDPPATDGGNEDSSDAGDSTAAATAPDETGTSGTTSPQATTTEATGETSTGGDDPVGVGPATGTLLVHGGGSYGAGFQRFIELAGGVDAAIVLIPTALEDSASDVQNPDGYAQQMANSWGLSNVVAIHTRDPSVADSDVFVAPILEADAVWFGGGRQWRFVDAYAGTQTEEAIAEVLDRGGLIGGSSAGASIQGSFLARGDTTGNTQILGDHVVGFGYLNGVAIDQHVAQRGREYEMFEILELDPEILGIGLDEATFIVVTGDILEVEGPGQVYVHDVANWEGAATDDDKILFMQSGARYDMLTRTAI